MTVLRFLQNGDLGAAEGFCFGDFGVGQFLVELHHQLGGGFVAHQPQAGQGAASASTYGNASNAQCGSFVAFGGGAGAEDEQFDGI